MQQLFIMRHGEALFDGPDPERSLSERGQRQVIESAAWLYEQCLRQNVRLLASPYRRTLQTAHMVSQTLDVVIEPQSWLMPDVPVIDVVRQWEALWMTADDDQCWVWVSHMPLVGRAACYLLEGPGGRTEGFGTAEVLALKADAWGAGCAFRGARHSPKEY